MATLLSGSPAWIMLALWFGIQLFAGFGADAMQGGVAYWAHAGGFIVDSSTRTLDTSLTRGEGGAPSSYETRLMVKLQLGLPWKPVLAWPWGVEHVIDPSTNRVVRHIEKWDVSAADGVAQLLKPGPPNGLRQGRRDDGGETTARIEKARRSIVVAKYDSELRDAAITTANTEGIDAAN